MCKGKRSVRSIELKFMNYVKQGVNGEISKLNNLFEDAKNSG